MALYDIQKGFRAPDTKDGKEYPTRNKGRTEELSADEVSFAKDKGYIKAHKKEKK